MRSITCEVNGIRHEMEVPSRLLLSDWLRHTLGLTGTHVGCEHGVCGACTVIVDGGAVRSCLMLAVQADGANITTIEGLAGDGPLTRVQEAFRAEHGLQCGFCTSGIVMSLTASLNEGATGREELLSSLGGHLCRCTGYRNIVRAIDSVLAPAEMGKDG
ncbi:MAG: (2Fe-2S)-binding protein [Candidatus Dormiibacterota bacterium]